MIWCLLDGTTQRSSRAQVEMRDAIQHPSIFVRTNAILAIINTRLGWLRVAGWMARGPLPQCCSTVGIIRRPFWYGTCRYVGNKAYRSMEMHSAGPLVRDILPASIAFPFKTVQYNSAEHTLRVHTHIIPKRNTASYSMIRLQSAVVKTQITRPSVMSLELPPLVRFGAPLSFLSPRGPLFQSRGFSIICTYKYK